MCSSYVCLVHVSYSIYIFKVLPRVYPLYSGGLFVLLLYVPVNTYGHYKTVNSPNHILEQAVKQYFVYILSLVTDNNPS